MSTSTTLGLGTSNNLTAPAAFIFWNWVFAYGVLSSRTPKQIYGLDHQSSPRQDLNKFGAEAVRAGKITQKQLDQLQRFEAASANSVEGFTLFTASVLFALIAGVQPSKISSGCAAYSVARIAYGISYVMFSNDRWAQIRGICWWFANSSCFYLLWQGATNAP